MKKIFIAITVIACSLAHVSAQTTFGLRLGVSPAADPGTNGILVNRSDPFQERLFNAERNAFSGQVGVAVRQDLARFWFMAELKYGQESIRYSVVPVHQYTEGVPKMSHYTIRKGVLEFPVTAGVKLGVAEIFSGFFLHTDLHVKDELTEMEDYTSDAPTLHPGWHTGLGVHLGNVLFDLRYQQEFGSYGKGYFINGQELLLYNSPGRFVMTVGYQL